MFEMEKTNTRSIFGQAVYDAAKEDDKLVALSGDSTTNFGLGTMEKEMPTRCWNMGIAEQNTMGAAAGLCSLGLRAVVCGFTPFVSMRAIEQFRTFIAYPHFKALVCGGMAGTSASTEGVTHQGLEDYGIFRMIPGTAILVPCDSASTYKMTRLLLEYDGPSYTRVGKMAFKKVYDPEDVENFKIGGSNQMKDGDAATILSCGAVLPNAYLAAEELEKEGIKVRLIDMYSIKPIDKDAILKAAAETGAIVTVEDHQINGGLGSAAAEVLAENKPCPMKRLGVSDVFTRSGDHYELLDRYGMGVKDIVEAVKETIARK